MDTPGNVPNCSKTSEPNAVVVDGAGDKALPSKNMGKRTAKDTVSASGVVGAASTESPVSPDNGTVEKESSVAAGAKSKSKTPISDCLKEFCVTINGPYVGFSLRNMEEPEGSSQDDEVQLLSVVTASPSANDPSKMGKKVNVPNVGFSLRNVEEPGSSQDDEVQLLSVVTASPSANDPSKMGKKVNVPNVGFSLRNMEEPEGSSQDDEVQLLSVVTASPSANDPSEMGKKVNVPNVGFSSRNMDDGSSQDDEVQIISAVTASPSANDPSKMGKKETLPCAFCPYWCEVENRMILHLFEHRNFTNTLAISEQKGFLFEGEQYLCHSCVFKSSSRLMFREHVRCHTIVHPYSCDECSIPVDLKLIREHFRVKHGNYRPSIRVTPSVDVDSIMQKLGSTAPHSITEVHIPLTDTIIAAVASEPTSQRVQPDKPQSAGADSVKTTGESCPKPVKETNAQVLQRLVAQCRYGDGEFVCGICRFRTPDGAWIRKHILSDIERLKCDCANCKRGKIRECVVFKGAVSKLLEGVLNSGDTIQLADITTGPGVTSCTTPKLLEIVNSGVTGQPADITTGSVRSNVASCKIPEPVRNQKGVAAIKAVPATIKAVPATVKVVPATVKAVPATTKAVPATIKAVPATTKAVPATIKAVPATTKAVPATIKAAPATIKAAPATIKAVPATTKAAPATTKAAPATIKAVPATIKAVPATIKAVPATTKAVPATVKAAPATIKAVPATIKAVPATINAAPATIKAVPATIIAVPATVKAAPATIKAVPATIKAVPATIKAVPATTKAVPATVKAAPATIKAVPATIKAVPATIIAVPATTKAVPATVKAAPATIKAVPATTKAVPATIIAVPATTKAVPATIIAVPATTKAVPATVKAAPATIKAVPAIIKAVPATVKAAPATIKAVPATIKAVPATTKAVPATIKAVPATIKAVPATIKAVPATVKVLPALRHLDKTTSAAAVPGKRVFSETNNVASAPTTVGDPLFDEAKKRTLSKDTSSKKPTAGNENAPVTKEASLTWPTKTKSSSKSCHRPKMRKQIVRLLVDYYGNKYICKSCGIEQRDEDLFRKHIWQDVHSNGQCSHTGSTHGPGMDNADGCPHINKLMQTLFLKKQASNGKGNWQQIVAAKIAAGVLFPAPDSRTEDMMTTGKYGRDHAVAAKAATTRTTERTVGKDRATGGTTERTVETDLATTRTTERTAEKDLATVGTTERTVGKDRATGGTTDRTVGKDQATNGTTDRTVGKDQATIGTTERTVGKDHTTIGTTERTAGKDQATSGTQKSTTAEDETASATEKKPVGEDPTMQMADADIRTTVGTAEVAAAEERAMAGTASSSAADDHTTTRPVCRVTAEDHTTTGAARSSAAEYDNTTGLVFSSAAEGQIATERKITGSHPATGHSKLMRAAARAAMSKFDDNTKTNGETSSDDSSDEDYSCGEASGGDTNVADGSNEESSDQSSDESSTSSDEDFAWGNSSASNDTSDEDDNVSDSSIPEGSSKSDKRLRSASTSKLLSKAAAREPTDSGESCLASEDESADESSGKRVTEVTSATGDLEGSPDPAAPEANDEENHDAATPMFSRKSSTSESSMSSAATGTSEEAPTIEQSDTKKGASARTIVDGASDSSKSIPDVDKRTLARSECEGSVDSATSSVTAEQLDYPAPDVNKKPVADSPASQEDNASVMQSSNAPEQTASQDNAPKQTAAQDNAPKQTALHGHAPKQTGSSDNAPKQTGPHGNAPKQTPSQDNASKQTASQGNAPKQTASTGNAPKQTTSSSNARKRTTSQDNAPKQTASQDNASKQTASQNNAPKQTASQNNAQSQTALQDNAPKQTTSSDNGPKQTASTNNAPKQTTSSGSAPKQTTLSGNAPKQTTSQDNAPKQTASQDIAPKQTASQDNAPKQTASQDNAPKQTASQDNAPKQTASQDNAPKQTASQDNAPKQTASQDNAPKQTASQDNAPKQTASQDNAPKQTALTNNAPKQTTSSGSAPKQTASSGNAPKQTISSGSAPKQTVLHSHAPKQTGSSDNAPKQSASQDKAPKQTLSSGNAPKQTPSQGNASKQTTSSGNAPKQPTSSGNAPKQTASQGKAPPKQTTSSENAPKPTSSQGNVSKQATSSSNACKRTASQDYGSKQTAPHGNAPKQTPSSGSAPKQTTSQGNASKQTTSSGNAPKQTALSGNAPKQTTSVDNVRKQTTPKESDGIAGSETIGQTNTSNKQSPGPSKPSSGPSKQSPGPIKQSPGPSKQSSGPTSIQLAARPKRGRPPKCLDNEAISVDNTVQVQAKSVLKGTTNAQSIDLDKSSAKTTGLVTKRKDKSGDKGGKDYSDSESDTEEEGDFFKCRLPMCGQSFSDVAGLRKHIEKSHRSMQLFPCPYCSCLWSNYNRLIEHIPSHVGPKPYRCVQCGVSYKKDASLRKHFEKSHHVARNFACTVEDCEFVTNLWTEFKVHVFSYHSEEKGWTCFACDTRFPKREDYFVHVESGMESVICCGLCTLKAKMRHTITRHSGSVHSGATNPIFVETTVKCAKTVEQTQPTGTPTTPSVVAPTKSVVLHECRHCDYADRNKASFDKHEEAHSVQKRLQFAFCCELCPFGSSDRTQYKVHLANHRKTPVHQLRCFKCTHCTFATNQMKTIEEHLQEMHKERPFKFEVQQEVVKANSQSKSTSSGRQQSVSRVTPQASDKLQESGKTPKIKSSGKAPKQTASTGNTPKHGASSGNAAKQTASSSNAAKQTASTDNAAKQTASSSNAAKQTASTDNAAKQTASSSNAAKQTASSSNAAKQTASADNVAKQTASSGNTPNQAASTGNVAKQTASSSNAAKQTALSSNAPKQAASSVKAQKLTASSDTAREKDLVSSSVSNTKQAIAKRRGKTSRLCSDDVDDNGDCPVEKKSKIAKNPELENPASTDTGRRKSIGKRTTSVDSIVCVSSEADETGDEELPPPPSVGAVESSGAAIESSGAAVESSSAAVGRFHCEQDSCQFKCDDWQLFHDHVQSLHGNCTQWSNIGLTVTSAADGKDEPVNAADAVSRKDNSASTSDSKDEAMTAAEDESAINADPVNGKDEPMNEDEPASSTDENIDSILSNTTVDANPASVQKHTYHCDFCKTVCEEFESFKTHMKAEHSFHVVRTDDNQIIMACPIESPPPESTEPIGGDPLRCKNCPFTSNSKDKMAAHNLKHSSKPKTGFKCMYCSYTASQRFVVTRHALLYHLDRPKGIGQSHVVALQSRKMPTICLKTAKSPSKTSQKSAVSDGQVGGTSDVADQEESGGDPEEIKFESDSDNNSDDESSDVDQTSADNGQTTNASTEIKTTPMLSTTVLNVKPETAPKNPLKVPRREPHVKFYKCIYCDFCSEDCFDNIRDHIFIVHLRRNHFNCVHCEFGSMMKSDVVSHCVKDHPGKDKRVSEDREYSRNVSVLETHGDELLVGMLSKDNVPLIELPRSSQEEAPSLDETRAPDAPEVTQHAAGDTASPGVKSINSVLVRTSKQRTIKAVHGTRTCKECGFSSVSYRGVAFHVIRCHLASFACPYCPLEIDGYKSFLTHVKASHPLIRKTHIQFITTKNQKLINPHVTNPADSKQQSVLDAEPSASPKPQMPPKKPENTGTSSVLDFQKKPQSGTHDDDGSATGDGDERDDATSTCSESKSVKSRSSTESTDAPSSGFLWKCTTCGTKLAMLEAMRIHVLTEHMKLQPYQCAVCDFGEGSTDLVETHIRETHQHSRIHIPVVDVVEEKVDSLKKEMIRVRAKKAPVSTDATNSEAFDYSELRTIGKSGESVYVCDLCDQEVESNSEMMSHRLSHALLCSYDCGYCDHKSDSKYLVQKHTSNVHTGRSLKYGFSERGPDDICEQVANATTVAESTVTSRAGQHTVTKKTSSSKPADSDEVTTQVISRASGAATTPSKEKVACNSEVISSSEDGVSSDDDQAPMYECRKCGERNPLERVIQHHVMLDHLKYRPYKCNYCRYSHVYRRVVRNHIAKSHAGKPSCIVYEPKKKLDALVKENVIQATKVSITDDTNEPTRSNTVETTDPKVGDTNERKDKSPRHYTCVRCKDYTTTSKTYMLRHLAKEIGYFPFECPHCTHSYTRPDHVKRHITMTHPGLEVQTRVNRVDAKETEVVQLLQLCTVVRGVPAATSVEELCGVSSVSSPEHERKSSLECSPTKKKRKA